MTVEYTQEELAEGIRNKDASVYEYMVGKYSKLIYFLAYNILSESCGKEDIEECVADVFLDVWIRIREYDESKGNFRTWLLVLAKYKALDYKRRMHPHNVINIEDVEIRDISDLENQVLLRQDQEKIMNIISSFQKTDRELFIRRFFLGEKINDLAKAFNLSRSAIDNRLLRGRKMIKEGINYE